LSYILQVKTKIRLCQIEQCWHLYVKSSLEALSWRWHLEFVHGHLWLCYSRLSRNFILVLGHGVLSVVTPHFALVLGYDVCDLV